MTTADPGLPALRPLRAEFLAALAGRDEILVSSRDGARVGTVPVWFQVAPPGVVLLLTASFSLKAQRWHRDPWTRLTVPGGGPSTEGRVRCLEGEDVDAVAELVVERFDMAGAATVEALHRLLELGTHELLAVEAAAASDA